MRTRPLTAIVVVLSSVAASIGGCGHHHRTSARSDHYETRTFTVPASGIESIDISTKKGRIDVAPHGEPMPEWASATPGDDASANAGIDPAGQPAWTDGHISIVAIVQSDKKDRLTKVKLEPRVHAGQLSLEADWPARWSDDDEDGVEYAIRFPGAAASVTVDAGFGDVAVVNWHGSLDIDTGFGDVRLHAVEGAVKVKTGFGDIDLEYAGPPEHAIHLDSGFGDIRAEHIPGTIDADTGFGDVTLRLTHDNPGPVSADSGFGDVRIFAGPAFGGTVRTNSGFGEARVYGVEHAKGDARSRASTGFGDAIVHISGESETSEAE
jgi:hypothetical protein